jgi:hypothetical protein
MERNVLYVGADDSNNHNPRKSRIVATVFSSNHEDSIYDNFSRERDPESFFYWCENPLYERSFRFALLTESCFNSMQPILPITLPRLILNYAPTLRETPQKVWICLDGILPKSHREYIRKKLKPYFSEVVVNNVVKRRNQLARRPFSKKLYCPKILKMADTCANQIYDDFDSDKLEERVRLNQFLLREDFLGISK